MIPNAARTVVLVCAVISSATTSRAAGELTSLERQRLVAHMEMTANWLIDEVSNLSQSQLEFRRSPGSWNIIEVVEHLVLVGPIYWDDLQKAVKGPPSARIPRGGDDDILWYGI